MVQEDHGKSITVVTGVPGSGKTRWGINRVADLIKSGIEPHRILVASFSRAAASEFLSRAIENTGINDPDLFPYIGTIHGICYRLLHLNKKQVWNDDWEKKFGIEYHWSFSIKPDQKWNEASVSYDFIPKTPADACLIAYRHCLRSGDDIRTTLRKLKIIHDGYVYKNYERFVSDIKEFKTKFNVLEFDDFLLEVIKKGLVPPVDYMFNDEFQDENRLQQAVIASWHNARACPLYLLGDADQTIYGFMGANPRWITEIASREEVKVIKLQKTHRFKDNIADRANNIISLNRERISQRIESEHDDMPVIHTTRLTRLNEALDQATSRAISGEESFILSVNNHYIDKIAARCVERGLPYSRVKEGNESPLEIPEAELYFYFKSRAGKPFDDLLLSSSEVRALVSIAKPYNDFFISRGLKSKLERELESGSSQYDERALLQSGFRYSIIVRIKQGDMTLLRNVDHVLLKYLDAVYSKYGTSAITLAQRLRLGTIHSVKGKETDHVYFLPDIMKKSFDSMCKDREEARRLFYVCITRAKKTFTVLRREWGKNSFNFEK